AHDAGHFSAEIAAVEAKTKKGKQLMTEDDHPRPQTTLEQLAKLQPVFKKGGTVTAANAPVNEAFAPQYLSAEKALGLDPENTNVNGGAIALGHPLVASGSRITAHLVHKLRYHSFIFLPRRRGGTYAVGSACTGGGQGIAIIFENTH
ncbi:THIM protein, partial [Polyodon spathula]|nr:THIM protein [Polyodon spathula]